jgi:hypothetical protein
VVLWGLCDGASAAAMYAPGDARVAGLALLNPWVRTEGGAAKATLKHYYRSRLLDPGLWKKIASGRFDAAQAAAIVHGAAAGRVRPQRFRRKPTQTPRAPPPCPSACMRPCSASAARCW